MQHHITAKLPGLDIQIDLPKGVQLRYDGEVPDLLENIALTDLQLKRMITAYRGFVDRLIKISFDHFLLSSTKSTLEAKFGSFEDTNAYCFYHDVPNTSDKLFVIAKKTGLGKSMSIFADGHESGEFLQKNGLKAILQKALSDEGIDIKVDQFNGEDFADLGGFLALLKAKNAGEEVFIPVFKTNPEGREKMGRMFGLQSFNPE
jgi:hypothetical protein